MNLGKFALYSTLTVQPKGRRSEYYFFDSVLNRKLSWGHKRSRCTNPQSQLGNVIPSKTPLPQYLIDAARHSPEVDFPEPIGPTIATVSQAES